MKKIAWLLVVCLMLSFGTAAMAASGEMSAEPSGEAQNMSLELTDPAWTLSADGSYYSLKNVVYCTNVVNANYQYMNIYVPAAYIDGGDCNGYTATTAPIVIENNCMGWNSSTPSSANTSYLKEGFIHISVGARSRNAENGTGKMPAPVVDQKAAVRYLRLNDAVIPGDKEKIVSLGSSGGGQMSSILGATGNMDEYYPYLYAIGAAGVELVDGEYVSTIRDDIYASMCYCPIVDLNNADLAYAWLRYDAGEESVVTMFSGTIEFSAFQLALQDDLAVAFCEYINSLGLVNEQGEALTFDLKADGTPDPRSGSYYDQTLANISNALNAWLDSGAYAEGGASSEPFESAEAYFESLDNTDAWLVKNADGSYAVTDLAGMLNGTGLARNKDIPGFDTFFATEEGNGFGTADEDGVHFSASVAAVLEKNYDKYSKLDGFAEQDVDAYIEQANRADIAEQAYLMNATAIMLNVANGTEQSDISRYWRTRNGTADEHTSFSIAYNLCLSASAAGADVDYSLVWNMAHGSAEGESTGTFVEWVHAICAESDTSAEPSGEAAAVELSSGGWPLSGSGDTSMDAYKTYLKAYMDCVPEMDGHNEELYGLIDAESWEAPVAMAWEDWFEENAMSFDEFAAANGEYSLHRFGETSPAM